MPVNAFTLFGTLSVDTSKFQSALEKAEGKLKTTKSTLDAVEKSTVSLGQTSATTSRNFEKLNSTLDQQRQKLKLVVDAYTAGKMSASQFATALTSVISATDKVGSSAKDAAARMTDLKNATDAAAQKARDKAAALATEKAALIASQEASKQKAAAEKALQQAVKDSAKAVKDASAATSAAIKQSEAAAKNAARTIKQALQDEEAAHKRNARIAQDAAKQVMDAAKKKQDAMKKLGTQIGGAADSMQAFGRDLSMLVTAPLVAVAALSVQSAIKFDALRNQVNAAAGSFSEGAIQFQKLIQIAKTSPGVFVSAAASVYAFMKQMEGISPATIEKSIKAMGRLQIANPQFDPIEFTRNLDQMIKQGFEAQDVKQAMGRLPGFGRMMAEKFKLSGSDYTTISKEMRKLVNEGKITGEEFVEAFADAVLNDAVYSKLQESLGVRLAKTFEFIQLALEPIGLRIGQFLEPALKAIEDLATRLGQAFEGMSPSAQGLVIILGAIAAAIGPLAIIFGTVIALLGPLAAGIATIAAALGIGMAPAIAVVVAAFVGLIAIITAASLAIYGLYQAYQKNFGGLRDIVSKGSDDITAKLTDLSNTLSTIFAPVLDDIKLFWDQWGADIEKVVNVHFKAIALMITTTIGVISSQLKFVAVPLAYIARQFIKVADDIQWVANAIVQILTLLVSDNENKWSQIEYYIGQAAAGIVDIIARTFGLLPNLIIGALSTLFPELDSWLSKLADQLFYAGSFGAYAFVEGIRSRIAEAREAFEALRAAGGGTSLSKYDTPTGSIGDPNDPNSGFVFRKRTPGAGRMPRSSGQAKEQVSPGQQLLDQIIKETKMLGVETKAGAIAVELLDKEYEKLDPTMRQNIINAANAYDKEKKLADIKKQIAAIVSRNNVIQMMMNATTEAEQEAISAAGEDWASYTAEQKQTAINGILLNKTFDEQTARLQAVRTELKAITDLGIGPATPTQRLNAAIAEAIKLGKPFTDEEIKKARAAIATNEAFNKQTAIFSKLSSLFKGQGYLTEEDYAPATLLSLISDNTPEAEAALKQLMDAFKLTREEVIKFLEEQAKLERIADPMKKLTSLMDDLGLSTKEVADNTVRWLDVLSNSEALEEMAKRVGMTVDELKKAIQFRIDESQNPTFFGQFRLQLEDLKKKSVDWTTTWATSLTSALTGIGSVLGDAVANWDGTLKGFWKSLVQGFRQLIGQIIGELVKLMAMQFIFKLIGMMGLSGAASSAGGAAGGAHTGLMHRLGMASGGLVSGRGTGTSDSIPAMLSNGEYVIPANVVKTLGVGFFEGLRAMQFAGAAPMPSVSNVSDNRSSSVANSNVFNINVASGTGGNQTATMIQKEILKGLQKVDKRSR